MENGEWKVGMESGGWRMENGGWKMGLPLTVLVILFPIPISYSLFPNPYFLNPILYF